MNGNDLVQAFDWFVQKAELLAIAGSEGKRLGRLRRKIAVRTREGDLDFVAAEPPAYEDVADSISSLIDVVKRHCADQPEAARGASVWVSGGLVEFVTEDVWRERTMIVELPRSSAYITLGELCEWHDQKIWLRKLRLELAEHVSWNDAEIAQFAAVRFQTTAASSGVVASGKESMGRSIDREASGSGTLPDRVGVTLERYLLVGLDADYSLANSIDGLPTISADVEIDYEGGRFRLVPSVSEMVAMRQRSVDHIHAMLSDELTKEVSDGLLVVMGTSDRAARQGR